MSPPSRKRPSSVAGGADSTDEHGPKIPKRVLRDRARSQRSRPDIFIYECEWEQCSAQLHNLANLEKHLAKIHAKPDRRGDFACRWNSCDHSFDGLETWRGHVEKLHVRPIANKLGYGPRDDYSTEPSESYLYDGTGRLVTPRIKPMEGSQLEDYKRQQATLLAPIQRHGMPPGMASGDWEDEYKLRQLEQKKLALGPTFERGGSILATDGMRRGFFDDEDFEGEYSADEDVPDYW